MTLFTLSFQGYSTCLANAIKAHLFLVAPSFPSKALQGQTIGPLHIHWDGLRTGHLAALPIISGTLSESAYLGPFTVLVRKDKEICTDGLQDSV